MGVGHQLSEGFPMPLALCPRRVHRVLTALRRNLKRAELQAANPRPRYTGSRERAEGQVRALRFAIARLERVLPADQGE